MSYEYSDKSRESDAHALPDVEVFQAYSHQCEDCSEGPIPLSPDYYGLVYVKGACPTCGGTVRCTDTKMHHWYAFGFPGCLWDSDPAGPFDTYEQALTEARESAGYSPHGTLDDDSDDPLHVDPSCPQCAASAQHSS